MNMNKPRWQIFVILIIGFVSIVSVCTLGEHYLIFNGNIYSKNITELRILEDKNLHNINKFPNLRKVIIGSSQNMHLHSLDFLEGCNLDVVVILNQDIEDWSALGRLTQLQSLIIYTSNFSDLNNIISLENLKTLIVNDSELISLDGISHLTKLTELSVHSNKLANIEDVYRLKGLEKLIVSANEICSIDGIETLTGLTYLNIQENNILNYNMVCNIVNLKQLVVSENVLQDSIKSELRSKNVFIYERTTTKN